MHDIKLFHFFAILFYYSPGKLAILRTLMSWACPGRVWGEEPAHNIDHYFLLSFFECV